MRSPSPLRSPTTPEGMFDADRVRDDATGRVVRQRRSRRDRRRAGARSHALTTGHLGGAGLDVFTTEPLHSESALWTLPNVIITPHSSGETERSDRRAIDLFLDNFGRHTRGEPLRNSTSDDISDRNSNSVMRRPATARRTATPVRSDQGTDAR